MFTLSKLAWFVLEPSNALALLAVVGLALSMTGRFGRIGSWMVVAAVAGGIPEMILPGKTGRLVPNRNPEALAAAIIEALKHPKDSARMAVAGKKLVEQTFTASRMVEGTLEVYLKLIAKAREYTP